MAASSTDILSRSIGDFGLDIYLKCSSKADCKNVFLSPYSIAMAVCMTFMGSKDNTAKQIKSTLHLNDTEDEVMGTAYKELLKSLAEKSKDVTFRTANRAYVESTYPILEDYKKGIINYFNSEITSADFVKNPGKTCTDINKWVEDSTNKKIKDLLSPDSIDSNTALVLVNAVYFKGDWLTKFNPERTKPHPFRLNQNSEVQVDMMHMNAKFGYGEIEELDCRILKLPYLGSNFAMYIVLPNEVDGLAKLESSLKFGVLDNMMNNLREIKIEVFLPKFRLEESYDLKVLLSSMGMMDLFSQAKANLSGISGKNDLYVSAAVHKAFVEVNEEGSEAAAATGMVMQARSLQISPLFVADHPFLFLIREETTRHVLFLGGLKNPVSDGASSGDQAKMEL